MCIRDRGEGAEHDEAEVRDRRVGDEPLQVLLHRRRDGPVGCLLYTSDAADERSSVDLGGRRIIKKKKNE